MSELDDALRIAREILDNPETVGLVDLGLLARQLIDRHDTAEQFKEILKTTQYDPLAHMASINQGGILEKHEEAVRRVRAILRRQHPVIGICERCVLALKVLDALVQFQPGADGWCGWPERSEP
jgi:hypothetical protein